MASPILNGFHVGEIPEIARHLRIVEDRPIGEIIEAIA